MSKVAIKQANFKAAKENDHRFVTRFCSVCDVTFQTGKQSPRHRCWVCEVKSGGRAA